MSSSPETSANIILCRPFLEAMNSSGNLLPFSPNQGGLFNLSLASGAQERRYHAVQKERETIP